MSLDIQLVLLLWGTLVGLDLVSMPQVMIARPIVAGAGAGLIFGDLETGLRVGVLFELFQFDILPVGAARYPEYGPATVAAVSAAHHTPGALGLGLAALVGLLTGMLGGLSIFGVRKLTARSLRLVTPRLEQGDTHALIRLHVGGITRDAVRAALVTIVGLALAWATTTVLGGGGGLTPKGFTVVAVAATAAALSAGLSGTLRLVGRGPMLRWFAVGLAAGAVVVWLR